MKRILFLLTTMLICGSINAQEQHYTFNYHNFEHQMTAIIQVNIDGIEQTSSDIELGAFNGENVTGSERIGEYGSAGYHRVYLAIYFNEAYDVTFKIYNHQTGEELDNCSVTFENEPFTMACVPDAAYGLRKNPVVLNFTTTSSQTLTKEITGYGNGIGNWYLIASPFADDATPTTVGMITNDEGEGENVTHTFDLYWFDQSEHLEWRNYRQVPFDLVNSKGYLYANKNDVTLTFTGTPIEGTTKEIPLVKDDNAEFPGWNLVGNPFAQTAYISKPFYTTNPDGTRIIAGTGNSIGAMEGIFVVANTDGETMTFSTEQRNEQNKQFVLNVNQNCGNIIDRAIVRFNDETTLPKFTLNRNSTKLYIPQNGEDYAMVSSEGIGEMPISFKAEENGTYTLSFDAQGVSFDYLHLIDNMTGNDVDLLAGASTLRVASGTTSSATYTFEAKTTDYASRFKLVFATICEDADSDNDFAFFSNGKLVILNDGHATFQVVDLMGRTVKSETINGSANINVNIVPGVYMLRLANGDDIKTQKIVME